MSYILLGVAKHSIGNLYVRSAVGTDATDCVVQIKIFLTHNSILSVFTSVHPFFLDLLSGCCFLFVGASSMLASLAFSATKAATTTGGAGVGVPLASAPSGAASLTASAALSTAAFL